MLALGCSGHVATIDGANGGASNSTTTTPSLAGLDTPVMCSSGTMWSRGNHGSSSMHPGGACLACHEQNDGPTFSVAGTVYPSAHEPDDCNGAAGATVVITDANGDHTAVTNSAGNFYARNVTPPFTAKVQWQGRERAMGVQQMTGDCNGCHTENGANGAPGRITLP